MLILEIVGKIPYAFATQRTFLARPEIVVFPRLAGRVAHKIAISTTGTLYSACQVPGPFNGTGLQADRLASGTPARANTRLACPSSALHEAQFSSRTCNPSIC